MPTNFNQNIRLNDDIIHRLQSLNIDPEEVTVCHWVGYGLSGRTVSLLEQQPGRYIQILGKKVEYLDLRRSYEDTEQNKKIYYEAYVDQLIPVVSAEDFELLGVKNLHTWETENANTKTVSLLKKDDGGLIWRITAGKVHTLIKSKDKLPDFLGRFSVRCRFPMINRGRYFEAKNPMPPWIFMMENLLSKGESFLKDHKLKDIKECILNAETFDLEGKKHVRMETFSEDGASALHSLMGSRNKEGQFMVFAYQNRGARERFRDEIRLFHDVVSRRTQITIEITLKLPLFMNMKNGIFLETLRGHLSAALNKENPSSQILFPQDNNKFLMTAPSSRPPDRRGRRVVYKSFDYWEWGDKKKMREVERPPYPENPKFGASDYAIVVKSKQDSSISRDEINNFMPEIWRVLAEDIDLEEETVKKCVMGIKILECWRLLKKAHLKSLEPIKTAEAQIWFDQLSDEILINRAMETINERGGGSLYQKTKEEVLKTLDGDPSLILDIVNANRDSFLNLIEDKAIKDKILSLKERQEKRIAEQEMQLNAFALSDAVCKRYIETIMSEDFCFNTQDLYLAARIFGKKVQIVSTQPLGSERVLPSEPLFNPQGEGAPVIIYRKKNQGDEYFERCEPLSELSKDPVQVTQSDIELTFEPTYHKVKSKFNRDLYVSPYEWGITLLQTRSPEDKSFGEDLGHLSIIIESVRNGKYHAEKAHLTLMGLKRNEENEKESIVVVLRQNDSLLQDSAAPKAEDCYHNNWAWDDDNETEVFSPYAISYSPTWIRRKEAVENMIESIESQIKFQNATGKSYHQLNGFGKDAFVAKVFPKETLNAFRTMVGVDNPVVGGESQHNCVTWAIDMLYRAGITVDNSGLSKFIASLPKTYANPSVLGVEDFGIRLRTGKFAPKLQRNKSYWKKIFSSKKEEAHALLYRIFFLKMGAVGPRRRNEFIEEGVMDERATKKLVEDFLKDTTIKDGLTNYQHILCKTHMFFMESDPNNMESSQPEPLGIYFSIPSMKEIVGPFWDKIIKNGQFTEGVISDLETQSSISSSEMRFDGRSSGFFTLSSLAGVLFGKPKTSLRLSIKPSAYWDEIEQDRNFPKTYRYTVQTILSYCLAIQICKFGLRNTKEEEWGKNKDHFVFV